MVVVIQSIKHCPCYETSQTTLASLEDKLTMNCKLINTVLVALLFVAAIIREHCGQPIQKDERSCEGIFRT